MEQPIAAFIALAAAAVLAACSGSDTVTVYGASSLKQALAKIEESPNYSFAGSDQLAQQIENGAPADLFAAASPKYAGQLAAKGLCEEPVPFASNTLVIIVPSGRRGSRALPTSSRGRGGGSPSAPLPRRLAATRARCLQTLAPRRC